MVDYISIVVSYNITNYDIFYFLLGCDPIWNKCLFNRNPTHHLLSFQSSVRGTLSLLYTST